MARRRGRKGKGHKQKAIPLLMLAPLVPAAQVAWSVKDSKNPIYIARNFIQQATGFDVEGKLPYSWEIGARQLGLVIGGMVVHRIANRTGVNKYMRKATMGYLVL